MFQIAGSPFHATVTDAPLVNVNAVKCYGPGLNPVGVRKGTPAVFSVDATQAGEAQLEVTTTDIATGTGYLLFVHLSVLFR